MLVAFGVLFYLWGKCCFDRASDFEDFEELEAELTEIKNNLKKAEAGESSLQVDPKVMKKFKVDLAKKYLGSELVEVQAATNKKEAKAAALWGINRTKPSITNNSNVELMPRNQDKSGDEWKEGGDGD